MGDGFDEVDFAAKSVQRSWTHEVNFAAKSRAERAEGEVERGNHSQRIHDRDKRKARTRMSREEFEKYYREQNRRSLEFLKRYSTEEQARILYYSARQDEQSFRVVVREDLPDTAANRSEWELSYKAWAECHARMLKARNDLLSGR